MSSKHRCPVCGSSNVRVENPKDFLYDHCGLTGVHLVGKGVIVTDCAACREKVTTVLQEAQLQQVLGMAVVLGGPGITGEQLRFLRKLFEMTQDELAQAIGKGRRETVAEWEAHERKRLFAKPYEELSLRVILMSLFYARVVKSEFCCLSMQHKAEFANAAAKFVEHASQLVAEREQPPTLRIRRQNLRTDWAAAPCVTC